MLEHSDITIKGWRDGLLVVIPQGQDWQEAVTHLTDRMHEAKGFWTGASAIVDVGGRLLSEEALTQLQGMLTDDFGVVPRTLVAGDSQTRDRAKKLGLQAQEKLSQPEKNTRKPAKKAKSGPLPPIKEMREKEARENAYYVKGTIRSGQILRHPGNLIICGDVNAGAEIHADGDILVFGTLRGMAHAGITGDSSARIVATNLRPTQLRIAGLIARSPDEGAPPLSKTPEVAAITDGEIHITPL